MKNRILYASKNGKFFCWHYWIGTERVSSNWDQDMRFSYRIAAKCKKCGRTNRISNSRVDEVQNHLIHDNIRYC